MGIGTRVTFVHYGVTLYGVIESLFARFASVKLTTGKTVCVDVSKCQEVSADACLGLAESN